MYVYLILVFLSAIGYNLRLLQTLIQKTCITKAFITFEKLLLVRYVLDFIPLSK